MIQPRFLIIRMFAMMAASVVISAVVMAILLTAPKHVSRLKSELPHKQGVDGVVEDYTMMGLLKAQWTYRDGYADGPALHYYPTGCLYRQLNYSRGKLDGVVREYHEIKRFRAAPPRGRIATQRELRPRMGEPMALRHYTGGVLDGPYEVYYEDGLYKEEGQYREGKRTGRRRRYAKDGRLVSDKYY